MADYACIIQEGQVADRNAAALETGLREISRQFFGDRVADTEFTWMRIAPGFAWTAGEPSTSSIVVRSVPAGYDEAERERFLRAVCDLWIETTGCSINEIVVTAMDGPLPL